MLIDNLLRTALFDTDIQQAGPIKQVRSSRFMQSMRMKPVGKGNLDKLESAPIIRRKPDLLKNDYRKREAGHKQQTRSSKHAAANTQQMRDDGT